MLATPGSGKKHDHRLVRTRIFVIPVVEKRVLHSSFRRQRSTIFAMKNLKSEIANTDWSMEGDIDEDYEKFLEKFSTA